MRASWLSPSAENRPTTDKGLGVFAIEHIPAGTTVAAFGGIVVEGAELRALGDGVCHHALQIDEDLFLASVPPFDPADYVNHSCDPNCGIVGSVLMVTRRAVEPGEELCFDYAMTDSDDYDEFECRCDTAQCRDVVRGTDWKRSDLQERYAGWFSAYLARRLG
jgi:SET domain-containing protein